MNTIKRFGLTAILLLFSAGSMFGFNYEGIYYHIIEGTNTCTVIAIDSGGDIIIPSIALDVYYTYIGDSAVAHYTPYTVVAIDSYAFRKAACTSVTIPHTITSIDDDTFNGCTMSRVTIPNSITSIGQDAFYNCKNLTSINIPNSVTSIGNFAFMGCSSLISATISAQIPLIPKCMFSSCTSLKSVTLPNTVKEIGILAFSDCSSLTSVNIPSSVKEIGNCAFLRCSSLASITIPSSVKEIGAEAFSGCSSLTSVNIPNGVTSLNRTFDHCTSLSSISIPHSVTTLYHTFSGCTSLTSVNIPSSVTSLDGTFEGCTSLTSVNIPNSVTSLNGTFDRCTSLSSIDIPSSVTSIGTTAFGDCSNLTSINIPKFVTSIGTQAFYECSGLRHIFCEFNDPYKVKLGSYPFMGILVDSCMLHVPAGSLELFKTAPQWENFFNTVENSIVKRFYEGFGTYEDWGSYYGMENEPTGLTADGRSMMKLIFVDTRYVNNLVLTVKVDGEETTETKYTGTFSELTVSIYEDELWPCLHYTAPAEFAYNTSSDSYKVEVTFDYIDDRNKHQTVTTDFDVYRPGVILLHGLLSDDGCFSGLAGYLSGSYSPGLVLNGDYSGSHAESFFNNTFVHNVVGRHMNTLFGLLAGRGIISGKYDLVGHSMGGILSRMYAQEVRAIDVNRIITLDTPHSGSQLANLRAPVMNTLDGVSVVANPMLASALRKLTSMFRGNGSLAAIENLAPGSAAIAQLNGPNMAHAVGIPVHSIVSVFLDPQGNTPGDIMQHQTSPASSTGLPAIYSFLYANLSDPMTQYNFLSWLYDGANDGVVSYKSQAGGNYDNWLTLETDVYRGKLGADSWAHHCKTNKWAHTYNKIDSLLRLPKSASAFRPSGFHPEAISVPTSLMSPAQYLKLKAAGSGTSIALQVERQEADSTVLQIHVTRSSDVIRHMVYTFTGNDEMIFSLDEQDCEFKVPDDYRGKLSLYVLGRTADGELVADEVVLDNGFIQGDVSGDGRVNVSDVATLINMILGVVPTEESTADVNGDGRVNVSDVSALINIILGIH